MMILSGKRVKSRSSLCDIVHENHKNSANRNVGERRRCLGLSASIFEFLKPRCSSRDTKKRASPTPHQNEKLQPILKSVNKPTLQDWITSSPSLNVQFSGRVHPANKEERFIEVLASKKVQPILKSLNKPSLQDWILSSPSFNAQFSGRVHPAYEEDSFIEVIASNILPIDSLCLERLKIKADDDDDDDDDDKQAEENSSIITRQSGDKRKKKVSFRLPEVADIFFMDSADGYYYSKK